MSKGNPEAFETFEFDLPPIRGFPELRWAGKRPFKSTQYYPAQKKESYGDPTSGWWNRVYWGDNLQVMSHLLRDFRSKIDLIYIDPPFDSKADYKSSVSLRGKVASNDHSTFEEKQYADIWNNDSYLQFMYDRLVISRELLRDGGSLYLHCDWRRSHQLRCILEEVYGASGFVNEISWCYEDIGSRQTAYFKRKHDTILFVRKAGEATFNVLRKSLSESTIKRYQSYFDENGQITYRRLKETNPGVFDKLKGVNDIDAVWLDINSGAQLTDWWTDISPLKNGFAEAVGYPTQKPEKLLERIIQTSSNPGDIVFDFFCGSGTTAAVSMKLGRRFIAADINLGAIETSIKRINSNRDIIESGRIDLFDESDSESPERYFTGLEVYNVNNYDLFRNPVEAKELIREAMELQQLPPSSAFDGQREGYLVKIMPVNRIATRQDLNEVINGLDFKAFERRKVEAPNKPVERIHLVCMGHEPDLGSHLALEVKKSGFDIEVLVTDLIRDKAHLHFKKSSDARLAIENGELVIQGFYPMNLLQKLSLESGTVEDWRQLVESVKVDFHYDGAVLTPAIIDAPANNQLVTGRYPIPTDAATIRVKITDLLSESWEGAIENG